MKPRHAWDEIQKIFDDIDKELKEISTYYSEIKKKENTEK